MRIAEFCLVDVLAAGPAGSQCVDLEVGLVDRDVDLLGLRQHRHGGGRGMDAAGALGVGHPLHAVHAQFEFELGERATPANLCNDLLVAAHAAFASGDHLDLPALASGESLIHPEQVAGEQCCLVAAGAGSDLQDDVALVHGVLGQERELDPLLQLGTALFQHRLLGRRQPAHLGVGRRIIEQRRHPIELDADAAIVLNAIDDRSELGEFPGQSHIGFGRELTGELGLERAVTDEERIEPLFRKHHTSTDDEPSVSELKVLLRREGSDLLADRYAAGRAIDELADQGGRLGCIEIEQHSLDRADRRG